MNVDMMRRGEGKKAEDCSIGCKVATSCNMMQKQSQRNYYGPMMVIGW